MVPARRSTVAELIARLDGVPSAPAPVIPAPPGAEECLLEYLKEREARPEEGDAGAQERLMNRYDWDHTTDLRKVLLSGAEE